MSGCAADKLDKAGAALGRLQARVALPVYPGECRKHEPHAALVAGSEALSVLKRERAALDRQNRRTDDCAGFYDGLKSKLN
ncbi:hypothetical protein [Aestuariivirga litoralis]|uniref:hypothetical protein n=1 Tax=Aestuariivirga litoralis TaxID=2650924 RepID=UPI0018C472D6|nr:hypothetical protein [Aestuariivirga litoralis]